MITKDNVDYVISQLTDREKRRIARTDKEFVVLKVSCFNVGCAFSCTVTNDPERYQDLYDSGVAVVLDSGDRIFDELREEFGDDKN